MSAPPGGRHSVAATVIPHGTWVSAAEWWSGIPCLLTRPPHQHLRIQAYAHVLPVCRQSVTGRGEADVGATRCAIDRWSACRRRLRRAWRHRSSSSSSWLANRDAVTYNQFIHRTPRKWAYLAAKNIRSKKSLFGIIFDFFFMSVAVLCCVTVLINFLHTYIQNSADCDREGSGRLWKVDACPVSISGLPTPCKSESIGNNGETDSPISRPMWHSTTPASTPTPTASRGSSPTRPTRAISWSYSCGKLNGEVARQAGILATILMRTSVRMSVSVSVSWNAAFIAKHPARTDATFSTCSVVSTPYK